VSTTFGSKLSCKRDFRIHAPNLYAYAHVCVRMSTAFAYIASISVKRSHAFYRFFLITWNPMVASP